MKGAEARVSDELANDPNYRAYQQCADDSLFKNFEPGTFVAFSEGQFVGTGKNRDELFKTMGERKIQWFFFHQVGVPEKAVHLPGPFRIR